MYLVNRHILKKPNRPRFLRKFRVKKSPAASFAIQNLKITQPIATVAELSATKRETRKSKISEIWIFWFESSVI